MSNTDQEKIKATHKYVSKFGIGDTITHVLDPAKKGLVLGVSFGTSNYPLYLVTFGTDGVEVYHREMELR